jgi:cytochrome c2
MKRYGLIFGTTMPFGGIKKPGQRQTLNCYLKNGQ